MNLLNTTSKHGFILRLCFILSPILVGLHSKFVESKSVATTTSPSSTTESSDNSLSTSMKNESKVMEASTQVPPNNTDVKSIVEVEGNSTKTKSTSSNYIADYKPLVFDSPEDTKTQQEWGGKIVIFKKFIFNTVSLIEKHGNCTLAHWDQCKVLVKYFGKYEDPKDGEIKEYLIDCREEPVVCLKNSWTVTRCNLLCMSKCNREIQFKYDKYVSHSGECQAHAHG